MVVKEKRELHRPPTLLKYKKGEQIIKQGDYGISIYKVVKGKVQVTVEAEAEEVLLAILGQGEILGEMIVLDRSVERRNATVTAIEESELEAWHPQTVVDEYEAMPPILKYFAGQALSRLIRMNRLITMLNTKKQQVQKQKKANPWVNQRRQFYRKEVNLPFSFRPLTSQPQQSFSGVIRDISLGGVKLEVHAKELKTSPYEVGDQLIINTTLPNGKDLTVVAKLVSINEGKIPGAQFWGASFTELTEHVSKILHFFLMP